MSGASGVCRAVQVPNQTKKAVPGTPLTLPRREALTQHFNALKDIAKKCLIRLRKTRDFRASLSVSVL